MFKNFLQKLIGNFSPDVFKPVSTGLLYVLLQSIGREISGQCPWDTGIECYKKYDSYWYVKCRNENCPGYRHPVGLIAYTSRSSISSSVDNRFDYSSFRYLSGDGSDWLPLGTLGSEIQFDFAGSNVKIGDKWDISCTESTGIVGPAIPDPSNKGEYGIVGTRGEYHGDNDTIYTIEIIDFWGYVQNFENALLQINLATCTEEWLDYWGVYFGLPRLLAISGYENDAVYRARIMKEITRAKGTRAVLLEEAKSYFGSDLITITEYHQQGTQSIVEVDGVYYKCILDHVSDASNRPKTGGSWTTYWIVGGLAGNTWVAGLSYISGTTPCWDGPVLTPNDPALGLQPWQFYINIPTQRLPNAKFVKDGSLFIPGPSTYGHYIGSGIDPNTYDPYKRDINNCYIYAELSFAKPVLESGLQDIIDRLKTAGTICIINPVSGRLAEYVPDVTITIGKMDLKWTGLPILGGTEVVKISKMNLVLSGKSVVVSADTTVVQIPSMNLVFSGNPIQIIETVPPEIIEIPTMSLIWTGRPCVPAYVSADKLLLHMNGVDGSTTFIDEYGHIFTAHDGAQLDTSFKKFGLSSGFFDGVDDYIDTPASSDFYTDLYPLPAKDWTFDFWLKRDAINSYQGIAGQCSYIDPDSTPSFVLRFASSNHIIVSIFIVGTVYMIISNTAITDANWHHIALVRDYNLTESGATVIHLYQDGVAVGIMSFIGNVYMANSINKFAIGRMGEYEAQWIGGDWQGYFSGWIDEVRYTVGIARWIGNFTPPTHEY